MIFECAFKGIGDKKYGFSPLVNMKLADEFEVTGTDDLIHLQTVNHSVRCINHIWSTQQTPLSLCYRLKFALFGNLERKSVSGCQQSDCLVPLGAMMSI